MGKISEVYRRNDNGPKSLPWGTPDTINVNTTSFLTIGVIRGGEETKVIMRAIKTVVG